MFRREYTVRFTVPAFLGDAGQAAAWRTPPFKALLRQWWRVAAAPGCQFDHRRLREMEGRLFGHAWLTQKDSSWSRQSLLGIRLEVQRQGEIKRWPPERFARIPLGKNNVAADLYLGYGPVQYNKSIKGTVLDQGRTALDTTGSAKLTILGRWPGMAGREEQQLSQTIQLMHWFSTLGGRSRNGWGSIHLDHEDNMPLSVDTDFSEVARPLQDCLQLDWPHAIGCDQRPLVWLTEPLNSWVKVVDTLAKLKGQIRSSLKLEKKALSPRILLAYPVTGVSVPGWGESARFANQLRFKVMHSGNEYRGVLVHLPCGLPTHLLSRQQQHWLDNHQLEVWASIHRLLDSQKGISRVGKVTS